MHIIYTAILIQLTSLFSKNFQHQQFVQPFFWLTERNSYTSPDMPKRKRNHEPSLEEKLTQWHKELARGMKTAKGFERQRLSKRIREAQAKNEVDKVTRLEREVAVLKVCARSLYR